jgi:nitrogen fixation protein NifU and related proteins
MSDDLRDLYQEVILDHGKHPRNFRHPEDATAQARGNNPLCGDQLTVYLKLDDDRRVADVAFEGRGCAISMASASMMTEMVRGKSEVEARHLFDSFRQMCTGNEPVTDADADLLDKLRVLSGVRDYPTRVKCATLPWHTLVAALAGDVVVTTE